MSKQQNSPDTPRKNSSKEKDLRKESDRMMEQAKKQQNAMPKGGEPIGGA